MYCKNIAWYVKLVYQKKSLISIEFKEVEHFEVKATYAKFLTCRTIWTWRGAMGTQKKGYFREKTHSFWVFVSSRLIADSIRYNF